MSKRRTRSACIHIRYLVSAMISHSRSEKKYIYSNLTPASLKTVPETVQSSRETEAAIVTSITQCLDGDWLGCLGRKTMGKECGAWVSRRLCGGGNTSPLKTTARGATFPPELFPCNMGRGEPLPIYQRKTIGTKLPCTEKNLKKKRSYIVNVYIVQL